jgi:hypothetical protein
MEANLQGLSSWLRFKFSLFLENLQNLPTSPLATQSRDHQNCFPPPCGTEVAFTDVLRKLNAAGFRFLSSIHAGTSGPILILDIHAEP